MSASLGKTEVFENYPVKHAVISQIVPAIASQMVALIYNLADTYFVGLINDPVETAAVTIVYPSFVMLTAVSNLFGIGGASAVARALGKREPEKAADISAMCFWLGLAAGMAFTLLFSLFADNILMLCGADASTVRAASQYGKWVISFGGAFTVLSSLLANLIRSDGDAGAASFGVSMGGILNIILDPIFILPQFMGLKSEGAGIATAISNLASVLFFIAYITTKRRDTYLSLNIRRLKNAGSYIREVLSIGLPSALQYALTVVAVAAQAKFVSAYTTEAVAALGIIKKLDQLPLYFSIGVSSGLLPLLAYNHAAGKFERRRSAFRFGAVISLGFSLFCLVLFEAFAPQLVSLFIKDTATVNYGAQFLRIMVLAMPMMSLCYPMIIQFQAMGKAGESLICSVMRKGILDIPLLFLMDALLPLYGCMWVQPIVDTLSLIVALILYAKILKTEKQYAL